MVKADRQPIYSFSGESKPDMSWEYTSCRKRHFWEDDGKKVHNAHFLKVGETGFDDGDGRIDVVDDFAWVCDYCGQHLKPGMKYSHHGPTYLRGPNTYYVNGEVVSEEHYRRQLKEEMDAASGNT